MRSLPDGLAFDRGQARAMGWSDPAISRAVRSGRLVAVRRGWFARPADAEAAGAVAVVLAHPRLVISHRSAAAMHAIPVVGARSPVPEVTIHPRGTGNTAGVHLYRATLATDDIVMLDGSPVTSIARTVVDLARLRRIECGVAAIDHVLHEGVVSVDDLERVLARCWNWPGARRARRARIVRCSGRVAAGVGQPTGDPMAAPADARAAGGRL